MHKDARQTNQFLTMHQEKRPLVRLSTFVVVMMFFSPLFFFTHPFMYKTREREREEEVDGQMRAKQL